MDKLPIAKILNEEDGGYTINAEVFGSGVDMRLRSPGINVRIMENGKGRDWWIFILWIY